MDQQKMEVSLRLGRLSRRCARPVLLSTEPFQHCWSHSSTPGHALLAVVLHHSSSYTLACGPLYPLQVMLHITVLLIIFPHGWSHGLKAGDTCLSILNT